MADNSRQCQCSVDAIPGLVNCYIPHLCKLHSSAPELLEALNELLEWAGKDKAKLLRKRKISKFEYMEWQTRTLNKAFAAIAKAEAKP